MKYKDLFKANLIFFTELVLIALERNFVLLTDFLDLVLFRRDGRVLRLFQDIDWSEIGYTLETITQSDMAGKSTAECILDHNFSLFSDIYQFIRSENLISAFIMKIKDHVLVSDKSQLKSLELLEMNYSVNNYLDKIIKKVGKKQTVKIIKGLMLECETEVFEVLHGYLESVEKFL